VPFGRAMCAAKLRTPNIWPDEPALVTAGTSGIGLVHATRFVAKGAHVLIPDIDGEKADGAAGTLGVFATAVAVDVTDEDAQRRMVECAAELDGGTSIERRLAIRCSSRHARAPAQSASTIPGSYATSPSLAPSCAAAA
jgi:NAD(P)-dependent dehydrogenase (short-subunit alcohol dehydrogenase family)